jgi:hypothetical protein
MDLLLLTTRRTYLQGLPYIPRKQKNGVLHSRSDRGTKPDLSCPRPQKERAMAAFFPKWKGDWFFRWVPWRCSTRIETLAQLFEFRHGVINSSPPATDGGPKAVGAGDNGGSPPGPTTTGQPQPMQPVSTSLYPRRLHAVEPPTRRTLPPMGTSAQNPTEEDREPTTSPHRQPGQTPPSGGLGRSAEWA